MAINQILSPFYLKMKYQTFAAIHSLRVYFETGAVLSTPAPLTPGDYGIRGATAIQAVAISEVAFNIFDRVKAGLPANTQLTDIEVWASAPGVNNFVANNVLPSVSTFGTGSGVAAAYDMLVFGSATRQKFRMTYFDTKDSRPQRYPGGNPPLLDNGSIDWYMMNSLVPFATQDGLRINAFRSYNTGYNRKLARSYGRIIQP